VDKQAIQADGDVKARPPRIRLWPLTLRLLLSLVLPVGVALLLDWALGTIPWLTMATSLLCIPLATVIVGNATLRDFERVVAQVAPYDVAPDEAAASAVTSNRTGADELTGAAADEEPPNGGRAPSS
jgi:hypothetical protein